MPALQHKQNCNISEVPSEIYLSDVKEWRPYNDEVVFPNHGDEVELMIERQQRDSLIGRKNRYGNDTMRDQWTIVEAYPVAEKVMNAVPEAVVRDTQIFNRSGFRALY